VSTTWFPYSLEEVTLSYIGALYLEHSFTSCFLPKNVKKLYIRVYEFKHSVDVLS